MSEIKKNNKILLLLHTIPIALLIFLDDVLAPTWFSDYINPDEAFSTVENTILFLLLIPFIFLIALWFKSLYNIVIPIIFDMKKISFWEAYGITLLCFLFGG